MIHYCGNIKNNKMEKEQTKDRDFNRYRVSILDKDENSYLDIKYFNKADEAISYFMELQIKFPDYFEVAIKAV